MKEHQKNERTKVYHNPTTPQRPQQTPESPSLEVAHHTMHSAIWTLFGRVQVIAVECKAKSELELDP
jgi:hypothetical protein